MESAAKESESFFVALIPLNNSTLPYYLICRLLRAPSGKPRRYKPVALGKIIDIKLIKGWGRRK